MLCYAMLYYTVLYYTILYYTILYCTILYHTILYYSRLHYSRIERIHLDTLRVADVATHLGLTAQRPSRRHALREICFPGPGKRNVGPTGPELKVPGPGPGGKVESRMSYNLLQQIRPDFKSPSPMWPHNPSTCWGLPFPNLLAKL